MRVVLVRSTHFNGRQPTGLNKNNLDCGISLFEGGGHKHGIKIPQQDFGLKMQRGGAYAREVGGGGDICGTNSLNTHFCVLFSVFHCSYISKNVVFSEKAVFTH